MNDRLSRNIPLFYVLRAMTLPYFWLPLLYFYLTTVKGFSVSQTTILLGLQEFLLIFLEVPTGVVADKISRKFSVGVGIAITSLPLALLPLVNSYPWALLIFATRAIGKSLVSGADSSLLYDTLQDLGRTEEFKKIKTQSAALVMGVATLCMFIGGWMGQMGWYDLALVLPFPLQLLAALAVSQMIEPATSKKAQQLQESNYARHVAQAIKVVLRTNGLIYLAIAFAVLEGTAVNMKWYYPAIFESLKYGLLLSGTIMSGLYGAKTIINAVGAKLIRPNAMQNMIFWTLVISGSWIISTIMVSVVVIPALVLILLALELATNSSEELIHDQLETSVRATAMSFVNLLSSVAATILLWSWGVTIQHGSTENSMILQGLLFVSVVGMILLTRGGTVSKK